jgi:Flp pilus assembly pilin Flp
LTLSATAPTDAQGISDLLVRKHDAADPASMCALHKYAPRSAHHEIATERRLRSVHRGRIFTFGTDREVPRNMNTTSSVSKKSSTSITLARSARGASMVEYALLLVAILLIAAGAFKTLGGKVNQAVKSTHSALL